MTTQLAVPEVPLDALTLEGVVVGGDLAILSPEQRLEWYAARCKAADLDVRTQPFQYLLLKGKLTLYATKSASDQLAFKHHLTVAIVERSTDYDAMILSATCRVTFPDGRTSEDIAELFVGRAEGEDLANARMKVVTKAKRRTILSACGLGGYPDETEVDSIPDARRVRVDARGNIESADLVDHRPAPRSLGTAVPRAAELPSDRAAVNATFADQTGPARTSRYKSREKTDLPAQKVAADGFDHRPWATIPIDEIRALNQEVKSRCEAERLEPFISATFEQVIDRLVDRIIDSNPDTAERFERVAKGETVRLKPTELSAQIGRFYVDKKHEDWRGYIRAELRAFLNDRIEAADEWIDGQVYGQSAPQAVESSSQEPSTAPEDESQVLVPEVEPGELDDYDDEGWDPGRE